MHPTPISTGFECACKLTSVLDGIVDVAHHRVLDGHATLRRVRVLPDGIEHFVDGPAGVDRYELVAQLIRRSMEAQRQVERESLRRELPNAWDEADRGHGDASAAHAEPVGDLADERADRAHHRVVVGERLPHAHEDDVVQSPRRSGDDPRGQHLVGGQRLREDLCLREVALQTALTRRTERAGHATTRLRRDAEGRAARVPHQDALEQRAVVEAPEGLDRASAVGGELLHLGEEAREQLCTKFTANACGQIGEVLRVIFKPVEEVSRDLVGAELRQPHGDDRLTPFVDGQIKPVLGRLAAARGFEHEWQLLHFRIPSQC